MIYYVAGMPCSDELYHHGILGMHWGVRRYQNPDGTRTAEGKIRYAAKGVTDTAKKVGSGIANKVASDFKNRHPSLMSDDELRQRMNRLDMENRYREMMRINRKPISRGKQFVQDLIESTGKTAATNIINNITNIEKEKALKALNYRYEEKAKEKEKQSSLAGVYREQVLQEYKDAVKEGRMPTKKVLESQRSYIDLLRQIDDKGKTDGNKNNNNNNGGQNAPKVFTAKRKKKPHQK